MRNYLAIGTVFIGLLLSSCSAPKPMSAPPPWRVCAEHEDPVTNGCKKDKASANITIRGHHEQPNE